MKNTTVIIKQYGVEQNLELNQDKDIKQNIAFTNCYDYNVGDIIGNCSFIKRIGAGGGSNIYLAYHNNFGRQVVIKEYTYFPSKSELELLIGLKHPHIPSVYDYIEKNERTYLIMEYIEGRDLSYILRDGSLSEDKILKYAVQLCDTVEYLHS